MARFSISCVVLQPMMEWTEAAMIAGAREVVVSPSIIGSLSRKEAALVEFFVDEFLQKLIDTIDSDESLKKLILSDRISKLVRIRLELQAPFLSRWSPALSIQAQPQKIPASFKQRAVLVDEIWHEAGDDATDIDWYPNVRCLELYIQQLKCTCSLIVP